MEDTMHRHKLILRGRLAGISQGPAPAPDAPGLVTETSETRPTLAAHTQAAVPDVPTAALLTSLTGLVDEIQKQKRQAPGELAQLSVELAAAIAERLVGAAIGANRQRLDRIVVSALERMQVKHSVVVRGHAEDIALLERLLGEQP